MSNPSAERKYDDLTPAEQKARIEAAIAGGNSESSAEQQVQNGFRITYGEMGLLEKDQKEEKPSDDKMPHFILN